MDRDTLVNVASYDTFISVEAVRSIEKATGCHVVLVVGYDETNGFVLFGARDADETLCARLVRWLNRNGLKSR